VCTSHRTGFSFPNIIIDGAVLERDDLHVRLVVSALVDQLGDELDVLPAAVRLGRIINEGRQMGWHTSYVRACGLGHLDEVTTVALKEAQKQEDLVGIRRDLDDTAQAHQNMRGRMHCAICPQIRTMQSNFGCVGM